MRFLLLLVVLVAASLAGLDARANPIPFPESGAQPYTDDIIPFVIFRSEKVVYTIDEEQKAVVSALYVLQNTENASVGLDIALPFDYQVPKDLVLTAGGLPVALGLFNSTTAIDYAFVSFRLDFSACETLEVLASYSIRISAYTEPAAYEHVAPGTQYTRYYWCRYIAETGRYWQNNLDTAVFQFRIRQELYSSGLKGFNVTRDGGYIVATRTYQDWRPVDNIEVHWQRPDGRTAAVANTPNVLPAVLVAVAPAALVIIYWLTRKGRRKRRGPDASGGRGKDDG
jgi:hypothetical protein